MEQSGWKGWQERWDRQQEVYLIDRERRFEVMFDVVEAVTGPAPQVLDLACGTGSISIRLLRRLPQARTVCLDLDPALLRIAAGSLAGDDRVTIVRADLASPSWVASLPARPYDAVLTATALHWLRDDALARLYTDLAHQVIRPSGVFCNADHMPDRPAAALDARIERWHQARRERLVRDGAADWETWWKDAAADPALADAVAERNMLFSGSHAKEFTPPVDWHLAALRASGFSEATVVWRIFDDAIVAALK
jgi:trans-aconitate methyltransferase